MTENVSMTATYATIGCKIFALTSRMNKVYDFARKMDSTLYKPEDEEERAWVIAKCRFK